MANAMRAMTVVQGEIPAKDSSRPTYRVHLPEMGSLPPSTTDDVNINNINNIDDGIEMVSAQGQKLMCVVPNPASDDDDTGASDEQNNNNNNNFDDVGDVLSSYVGQCFLRQDGWWSYEFCYNRSISQFHKAREPEEEELSFTLGLRNTGDTIDTIDTNNNGMLLPYTEVYTNGTVCDVSGKPRSVTVKYICADDTSQMGGITRQTGELFLIKSIKEVETCVYELEFISSAICKQKMYKRSRHKSTLDIKCSLAHNQGPFRGLKATSHRKGKATLTL